MTLRNHRTAAALAFALAFSSCKSGGDEKTTPTELVAVTASQASVFANGVNTVGFHVTSTGSGPISVTTDRGTFQDTGSTATSVPGTSGDVVLVTCDAVATPACAGPARVTARRPGTAAQATVAFGGLPTCASDCAADAACADYPCSSGSVPSGFCTAGACALPPTVTITPSQANALANGVNAVSISVSTTSGGPVTVTTTRGSFPGGVQSAVIAGASGTLVLTTCDAATSSSCAGNAVLTATDRTGTTKTAQVTFGTMALCSTDCSIDAACTNRSCSTPTLARGFCLAGACAPPPTVTVLPSRGTALANGVNTVELQVSTTGNGPITVSTTRGTFAGGASTATIGASAGNLVLTTCNTATSATCAGNAVITATDATGTSGTGQVTFGTTSLCTSDCAVDAASCEFRACTSASVRAGFCSAGACALPPTVSVTPSRASALANGVNTIDLLVRTTGSGPITVTTSKGTFAGGVTSTVVNGASGNLVLTTCNTATSTTCAGNAVITATDPTGTSGSGQVTFGTVQLCAADCSVDPVCAGHSCSSAAVRAGFCSAGACAPPPTVTVTPSRSTALANGFNSVNVQVSTSGSGPLLVTTSRGTFPGGVNSTSIPGASGTLALTTCNAATSATCVGTALVTATDPTGTAGTGQVTFGTSSLCAGDCTVDVAACASHACSSPAQPTGICISGTCSPVPVVTVTPSVTSVLADGTQTVNLAVSTTGAAGPIAVTTTRGTFSNGGTSTSIAGTSGTLVLTTCDSVASLGCAGSAAITATDPTGIRGTAQVAFVDVVSGAAITVTPGRARLPADGTNTTPVVVRVTRNGTAASGVAVTLGTTLGSLSATSATTGNDGTATVTFTAPSTSGVATLSAAMTSATNVSASATITMPALGPIQIGSVQYTVMGVRGSSYRELSAITVAVLDDQNKPYPDGLAVHFEHVQLGGSEISGTPVNVPPATCGGTPGCVAFDGATDINGLARVNLSSGTTAGTLIVTAGATAGGLNRTFTAPNVAVVGAKASGGNFSIVCSPRNVPALTETNCSTSDADHQFNCQALLKDRFGNLLGTQTQVTFMSEAGAVGPPTTTPAYAPGTSQPDLGVARQYFRTLGAGIPASVPIDTAGAEPSAAGTDGCGRLLHPRNGAVTVVAIADGEEAFVDINGSGAYDGPGSASLPAAYQASGEPFIDLGEPFVDANDNGAHDAGEEYLDVNQDGTYDGPNGTWDPVAKIWTQTVVVYSGRPELVFDLAGNQLGTRWAASSGFPGACTATPTTAFSAPQGSTSTFYVVASDRNLNRLAASTTHAVAKTPSTAPMTLTLGPIGLTDELGFSYQYFVCGQDGTECSDRCQASATNLPCIMRPSIAGYLCGNTALVTIRGPSTAATATSCTADWNVETTYTVLGSSKKVLLPSYLPGTAGP